MKSRAVDYLLSNQNPNGGWGYAPLQSSAVEPTSAVLLALREIATCAESRRRAIEWLRRTQHPDGGWGFNSSDAESAWQTAWAVLALTRSGEAGDVPNRGGKWLLNLQTLQLTQDTMQSSRKILKIDLSLRGWPWLPGEATWIEPTALSMLALESIADIAASARMHEAICYIQDRRCPGGGWNFGNPIMFNSPLPARAHTTALVLLALRNLAPISIRPEDIRVLRSEMHRDGGVLGLAFGLLALRTLREDDPLAEVRLSKLQGQNGGWAEDLYKTAVAMMALRGKF
jgi:Squalene-hopene cyclase C-terminal domain